MKFKFLSISLLIFLFTSQTVFAQESSISETKTLNKIILFKWKDSTTENQKKEVQQLFKELVDEVEGFNSFRSISVISEKFETMYVLKFDSELAEESYKKHEKHRVLVEKGPELIADVSDYLFWE